MKVIVPCAGKSSRYPNMRPKWMLTHPDGNLMVKKAIEGCNVSTKDVIITILKEHEDKYDIIKGLKENIGDDATVVVLEEPTKSQSETVYKTLVEANVQGSFLVRDSDNMFEIDKVDEDFNYVCISDIHDYEEINAGNKSYVKLNESNIITDIVEKKVVSSFFNVGGYYFADAKDFKQAFEDLKDQNRPMELFVSNIIEELIVNKKKVFVGKKVTNYFDWGTAKDWFKYKQNFKTYFIALDGIVFANGSQFFKPRISDAQAIRTNVSLIKKLCDNPYIQIFFITARPEELRAQTEESLKELGIKYKGLIMGCFHAKRVIASDFSHTTGYPACESINILRDSEDLEKYIT